MRTTTWRWRRIGCWRGDEGREGGREGREEGGKEEVNVYPEVN